MSDHYRIRPVNLGTLTIDKSAFTYLRNFGQTLRVPCLSYYLDGPVPIVVDTGPVIRPMAAHLRSPVERTEEQEPARAYARAGVDPNRVAFVVLTHLHWDHCGANHLFPNARFVVQRKELRYAASPLPVHRKGYEAVTAGFRPDHIFQTSWTDVDGDTDLEAGIRLILTPGHTPGFQSVVVPTAAGTCVIAGDTVPLFENWEGVPEASIPHLPNGIHHDLEEYSCSLERIEQVADWILPGHEPLVLERTEWP